MPPRPASLGPRPGLIFCSTTPGKFGLLNTIKDKLSFFQTDTFALPIIQCTQKDLEKKALFYIQQLQIYNIVIQFLVSFLTLEKSIQHMLQSENSVKFQYTSKVIHFATQSKLFGQTTFAIDQEKFYSVVKKILNSGKSIYAKYSHILNLVSILNSMSNVLAQW